MMPIPAAGDAPAYDVFNGDADGLCALHQLRLAQPRDTHLITGVKRDIALLQRVPCASGAAGMAVTVLDISLDVNLQALRAILDGGGTVRYFDHHSAQHAFPHPQLQLFWDDAPDLCSSLLVDRHLGGRYRRWAIAAAFGDNLQLPAAALARRAGLDAGATKALAELGQLLNYNAYGECLADLHYRPDQLYRAMQPFADPFDFIAQSEHYRVLAAGWREDGVRMHGLAPHWQRPGRAIYLLPDMPWARRISGPLANSLAARGGGDSFAVLSAGTDGNWVVSVRSGAPEARAANRLCEQFPGGGGRKAAAGINRLPASELDRFIAAFDRYFTLPSQC